MAINNVVCVGILNAAQQVSQYTDHCGYTAYHTTGFAVLGKDHALTNK